MTATCTVIIILKLQERGKSGSVCICIVRPQGIAHIVYCGSGTATKASYHIHNIHGKTWGGYSPVNHTHLPTRGLRGPVESRKDQRRPIKYSLALSCSVMVKTSEVSSSHAMWGYLWGGVRGVGGHICVGYGISMWGVIHYNTRITIVWE